MKALCPKLLLGWFLVLLTPSLALAELRLPAVIGSGMVLQRDREVPVWGWASPGDEVTIVLGTQSKTAKAGEDGRWAVNLEALPAGGPHKITVSSGASKLELENVMVGEVWLCSGQSNMEWSVSASKNSGEEIAAAKYPKIRLFHVPKRPATLPQDDTRASWKECSPETIPGFSAVGYFFGRELHKELDVPIGLIASSWGGTRIEPWTPLAGFASVPSLQRIGESAREASDLMKPENFATAAEEWAKKVRRAAESNTRFPPAPRLPKGFNHGSPTGLYNGMIAPVVPYAIRGATWYQGESNNGEGMAYHDKMKALINGWRSVFGNPDLSFYFVQLAPYRYGNGEKTLPYLWEAQCATLAVKGTGMAVTTDIGNTQDIHPRNKQDVGKRLALWALARDYGKQDLVSSGPLFKGAAIEGDKIRVSFAHTAGALKSRDDKPLSDFTIAGADKKFVPATAVIEGETVIVHAAEVTAPQFVRFGWHHMINPNLMNAAGLPASPFKSDGWKGATGE